MSLTIRSHGNQSPTRPCCWRWGHSKQLDFSLFALCGVWDLKVSLRHPLLLMEFWMSGSLNSNWEISTLFLAFLDIHCFSITLSTIPDQLHSAPFAASPLQRLTQLSLLSVSGASSSCPSLVFLHLRRHCLHSPPQCPLPYDLSRFPKVQQV